VLLLLLLPLLFGWCIYTCILPQVLLLLPQQCTLTLLDGW
jgi:hypothetical protein